MSYILNALRKSERERMALQADTVTDRILVNQPQPRHKTGKLMLLLMLSNVIAVASLVWYVRKEPNTPLGASQQTSAPEKIQLKPESVESIRIIPKLKSEPASPALAELAASKKAPVEPHPAIKAVVEKQPEPTQAKSDSVTEMAPESSTETQLEPVDMIEQKPEAKIENKTIPFLFELPQEFRARVPALKINVFVYAEQPADRFVMIDMVKYTIGQRIKESIKLKEIRQDSLVVEYDNVTFKIKRP